MNEIEATRAKLKCLEMVEGTDLKWLDVIRVKSFHTHKIKYRDELDFYLSITPYEVAIAIVEGKPVWKGDELFVNGEKKTVVSKHPDCDSLQWRAPSVFSEIGATLCGMPTKCWSWQPPQPKTVMVELPIEVVERAARQRPDISPTLTAACQKALNNLETSK